MATIVPAGRLRLLVVLCVGGRQCRFSHGGQFFAAVNGNTIQIFNHYTFDNIGNLRGHNSKVRSARALCSVLLYPNRRGNESLTW